MRSLSGGERSRLELALLGILPSNLLLLDEPTNHLDIAAREAIESFLVESPATLLVVSHDRRLLETVCSTLWVVDDGLAVPFDGGWKAWRTAVADGWTVHEAAERERRPAAGAGRGGVGCDRAVVRDEVRAGRRGPPRTDRPEGPLRRRRPDAGGSREKLSKDAYRRQKIAVDAELTRLGLRKTQLELSMGSPAISANFVEMRRVASELADVEQALASAEDAWLELEERAP